MKIKELRKGFVESLSLLYGKEEALSFFYILTNHFLELKRVEVAVSLDTEITLEKQQLFLDAKKRLEAHEPVQYIIEEAGFFGLSFIVNPSVLIPRQETEELVDWILNDLMLRIPDTGLTKGMSILDIGTGSGCIAISLAKKVSDASIFGMDISSKALEVAKQNAAINKVKVEFIRQDILQLNELPQSFDTIVSNPPYVRELEKKKMQPNVLENEPEIALFVPDHDPLIFYTKITELAIKNLKTGGTLYFEINQYLGKKTKEMIQKKGFSTVILKKDIQGNDRMIKAIK